MKLIVVIVFISCLFIFKVNAQVDTIKLSAKGVEFNKILVPNGMFGGVMVNGMSKEYLDSVTNAYGMKYKKYKEDQNLVYEFKGYPIDIYYAIDLYEFYCIHVYIGKPNSPVLLYNGMELVNELSTFTNVCIENPIEGMILTKAQGGSIFTGFCQAKLPNFLIGFSFKHGEERKIDYVTIYFR